jgi:hypothetical protein
VTQFVELGAIPVDRLEIGFLRRDLNEIRTRRVERHFASYANVCAGSRDDVFDMWDHLGMPRKWFGVRLSRQAVALVTMEDSEAFEEANAPRFLA